MVNTIVIRGYKDLRYHYRYKLLYEHIYVIYDEYKVLELQLFSMMPKKNFFLMVRHCITRFSDLSERG